MVPVLKPIIVTLAVFTLLGTWNDFMWPLIVLADQHLYTLPVALASLVARARAGQRADDGGLGASRRCPCCVVFLALQRYYMQGLMAGSVKG